MPICLNTNKPLENYKDLYRSKYFVDKSMIIENLNELLGTSDKYVCVTRPRRFGKSSVADMIGAYYSKGASAKEIFDALQISKSSSYGAHLNKHNVINIAFNKISEEGNTYEDYIRMIRDLIITDIVQEYPQINPTEYANLSYMLRATNDKFIFVFDEWDYIFTNNFFVEHHIDFLEFLRNLIKDEPYVLLCYMTGVLPIKKYSSGSALNMFDEFTMLNDMLYGEYFGFTEEEVEVLCKRQSSVKFDELREWYNGYMNEEGTKLYNPRSVVKALRSRKCKSYWTNTGAMDEVAEYLKLDVLEVRDDVIEMVSGESVDIIIDEEFRAGQGTPRTKEEIYSAMIILGFLSYHEGELKIPNKELMKEFEKALRDKSFGYVAQIIDKSKSMLKATLNGDTKCVELKKDQEPDVAINQIKEKEYVEKFLRENENQKVLAVAICYDSKAKEHKCKIEEIRGYKK